MPAIDMFMLLSIAMTLIAFQMTVPTFHTLDIGGTKAFLRYFDSVCAQLVPSNTKKDRYKMFLCVPADVCDKSVLTTHDAENVCARVSQWLLKIE
mmetsp:Transcript_17798/g.48411  ORF Transcript_17798/g.48411 Transcript_17798/m.48411 type:complete len:95 (+) Transcript_17798:756-1040(+)